MNENLQSKDTKKIMSILNNPNFNKLEAIFNDENKLKILEKLLNNNDIEDKINQLNELYNKKIQVGDGDSTNLTDSIEQLLNKVNLIEEFYNDFIGDKTAIKYHNNTSSKFEYLTQNQTNITNSIEKIKKGSDDLKALTEQINNTQKHNETLTSHITEYKNTLTEYKNKLTEYKNKLNDLTTSISNLLPSALSAKLSYAYQLSKNFYKPTTQKSKLKDGKYIELGCLHKLLILIFKAGINDSFRYFTFLGPLVFIIYFNLIEHSIIEIKTGFELFIRILSMIPLAIVSYFGFTMIRNNKIMFEEYHHKENIIALYEGLREKLETEYQVLLNNPNPIGLEMERIKKLLDSLYEIVFATVSDNPNKKIKHTSLVELIAQNIQNKKDTN